MMNYQYWPEISNCLSEVEKETDALTKRAINLDALTASRDTINRYIDQLRLSLEQGLNKQHASQIIFALVAYLDEKIQAHIVEKGQGNWVPLQKDLYGAYNAGNLFYDTIDKLVEEPNVPEFVFEVFYFVLKRGFVGKYRDAKTHVLKYMDVLKDKMELAPTQFIKDEMRVHQAHGKRKIQPWHYYGAATFSSIVLLALLYFFSKG